MTSPITRSSRSDFSRLWTAQAISEFGARISREGLPIMAVLSLGGGPAALGLLAALSRGSPLLIGLTSGGFVDRSRRRPILIAMDLFRAAALLTLPLAALWHGLGVAQVCVVAVLVGAASALFDIAALAYLPTLVGREAVIGANAKLSATESMAETAGPALGGLLFQWLTAPFAVAINAVTYLASALALSRIRGDEPSPVARRRRSVWDDIATGARITWAERSMRALLLMSAVSGLFGGAFSALYILYALRTLHLPTAVLGLGIATGGLGSLAATALAVPVGRRIGVGPAICLTGILSALGTMLFTVAPATPAGASTALFVSQFTGDFFGTMPLILGASLQQTLMPHQVLGRVGATFRVVAGVVGIAGALVSGALAQAIGPRATLQIAIVGLMVGPLIGVASPLWRVRVLPDETLSH
jgi:MFS family permease